MSLVAELDFHLQYRDLCRLQGVLIKDIKRKTISTELCGPPD